MARDYARSRTSRRNARIGVVTPRGGRRPSGQRQLTAYRQPRRSRSFLWLFFGIILGLLIAAAVYFKESHLHTNTTPVPAPPTPVKKLQNTRQTSADAETTQPHYDFYTMLPKDDVETAQPAEKEKIEKEKRPAKIATTARYQLQVASFSSYQDADHLKAQLILQGYNASIKKQQRNGVVHYRVNVGPFDSSKAAVEEQQNLSKNKIKSIVLPL